MKTVDDWADVIGMGGLIALAVTLVAAVILGMSTDPIGFSQAVAGELALILGAIFLRRTGRKPTRKGGESNG